MAGYIQNEPVGFMDLNTLWNDRRDPHASPLSQDPRRSIPRPTDDPTKGLTSMLGFLYHGPA